MLNLFDCWDFYPLAAWSCDISSCPWCGRIASRPAPSPDSRPSLCWSCRLVVGLCPSCFQWGLQSFQGWIPSKWDLPVLMHKKNIAINIAIMQRKVLGFIKLIVWFEWREYNKATCLTKVTLNTHQADINDNCYNCLVLMVFK